MHVICHMFKNLNFLLMAVIILHKTLINVCIVASNMLVSTPRMVCLHFNEPVYSEHPGKEILFLFS